MSLIVLLMGTILVGNSLALAGEDEGSCLLKKVLQVYDDFFLTRRRENLRQWATYPKEWIPEGLDEEKCLAEVERIERSLEREKRTSARYHALEAIICARCGRIMTEEEGRVSFRLYDLKHGTWSWFGEKKKLKKAIRETWRTLARLRRTSVDFVNAIFSLASKENIISNPTGGELFNIGNFRNSYTQGPFPSRCVPLHEAIVKEFLEISLISTDPHADLMTQEERDLFVQECKDRNLYFDVTSAESVESGNERAKSLDLNTEIGLMECIVEFNKSSTRYCQTNDSQEFACLDILVGRGAFYPGNPLERARHSREFVQALLGFGFAPGDNKSLRLGKEEYPMPFGEFVAEELDQLVLVSLDPHHKYANMMTQEEKKIMIEELSRRGVYDFSRSNPVIADLEERNLFNALPSFPIQPTFSIVPPTVGAIGLESGIGLEANVEQTTHVNGGQESELCEAFGDLIICQDNATSFMRKYRRSVKEETGDQQLLAKAIIWLARCACMPDSKMPHYAELPSKPRTGRDLVEIVRIILVNRAKNQRFVIDEDSEVVIKSINEAVFSELLKIATDEDNSLLTMQEKMQLQEVLDDIEDGV